MRRARVLVALALLAAGVVHDAPAVHAYAGAGVAQVACHAEFPHVPATSWTGGGTCFGSATVYASGMDYRGVPWSIGGSGAFGAWFDYHEPCLGTGAFVSFASGEFYIPDVSASYLGASRASIYGWFDWDRVGMNPVIRIYNLEVHFTSWDTWVGTSPVLYPMLAGAGTAAFTSLGTFDPNRHFICATQPGGPLELDVAMTAAVEIV